MLVFAESVVLQPLLPTRSTKEASPWLGEWKPPKGKANQTKMQNLSKDMDPIACLVITCMAVRDNK